MFCNVQVHAWVRSVKNIKVGENLRENLRGRESYLRREYDSRPLIFASRPAREVVRVDLSLVGFVGGGLAVIGARLDPLRAPIKIKNETEIASSLIVDTNGD